MQTVVHLIITGMIVVQPYTKDPGRWRVLVPDFANFHHHSAEILVAAEDMQTPPAGGSYYVLPLAGHTATVRAAGGGSATLPSEMITLEELCDADPGDCAVVHDRADLPRTPALELIIEGGALETSGTYPEVAWSIVRRHPNVKKPKPPITKGEVAEEVCLIATVDLDRDGFFSLPLKDSEGKDVPLRLKPDGNKRIEVRISNLVPPKPNQKFDQKDPHLQGYYDLVKRHGRRDLADLITTATKPGDPREEHSHKLTWVAILNTLANASDPNKEVYVVGKGARQFPTKAEIKSMTGSNCPPTGDPYP